MEPASRGQESAVINAVGPRAQLPATAREDDGVLTLPRSAPPVLDCIRALVHALEDDPGQTARALAERVDLVRRDVVLILLRLEEHGLVVRDGRCWYPGPEAVR
jgi:predicted Rossmann fold nucleotide-binding protein DprA/Smf involved in DNA uptake